MDINQSSLSRSKLNKLGISRSVSENRAITEANKGKDMQGSQSPIDRYPLERKEGQVVKGQILDHRYNEIRIQLEPGKQVVTAKLSGDIPLTIGQNARFAVVEDGSDRLVLRYLPEGGSASETAIEKALTYSGLPMTDRNRAIVEELLNHMMPVDKQTLQTLIRLSNSNREASPLTLVLMMKNNIPMTSSNIRQFEAYQNGSGQLLKDIQAIAKDLTQLLHTKDEALLEPTLPWLSSNTATGDFNQQTSHISSPVIKINQQLLDLIISERHTSDWSATRINQMFDQEDLQRLYDTLIQKSATQPLSVGNTTPDTIANLFVQLKEGTLTLYETKELVNRFYPEMEQAILSNQAENIEPLTALQNAPLPDILQSFSEQYAKISDSLSNNITAFLSQSELTAFKELLRETPSLAPIAEQLNKTALPAHEVLRLIHDNLNGLDEKTILSLISSSQYERLLEHTFHDRWTITPEKLAKQEAVSELYDNLVKDLDLLKSITNPDKLPSDEAGLQKPVNNLQENLRFLSDLNEMFTYLQLPIQLQKQDIHSELYVYTRKKALQSGENLSVLLHLDMSNLGSMNIHIQLNHNIIHTKFYMEDEEAKNLVAENISALAEALTKKGYHLQYEVNASYEKPDFSKNFIEEGISESDVRRYTFDIRT